ncbi:MAG: tRNA modification GTPase [Phycisphaerae bacterium]|jgi:tRNA modification GTPase
MSPTDTIVAVSSAPGTGSRALVRVSGDRAFIAMLHALGASVPQRRGVHATTLAVLGEHYEAVRCAALVVVLPGPKSFTGQDTLELALPANTALVERVVAALTSQSGVRLAQPGEFTARAFLAGRMTLEQAEGVAAFIAAQHEEQLDAARDLKAGMVGITYRAWADELTTLLALVEAGIDFTDQEDVVPIPPARLHQRVLALRDAVALHLGGAAGGAASTALPRVALVGVPNAGKSTLFNALLGRERAVASTRAGTTRDIIEEELDLSRDVPGAGGVLLQDLPGLSFARDAAAGDVAVQTEADIAAQHAARAGVQAADVLVWCDPTGRFDDRAVAALLQLQGWNATKAVLRVRTFGDQVRASSVIEAITVCAVDGWNLASLRRAIADQACVSKAAGVAALLPRYRRSLNEASAALARAAEDVPVHASRLDEPETVAESLRLALMHIGELVGNISPDDVLGRVFATFCVGK